MKTLSVKGTVCAFLFIASSSAQAIVTTTLGGTTYDWMEVTATASMSRDQVETELANPNSPLFGFEYASRTLVEDLLHSYASWDGLDGWHGSQSVIDGTDALLNDFGVISSQSLPFRSITGVDSITINYDARMQTYFLFGSTDECGTNVSCRGVFSAFSYQGVSTGGYQADVWGWDSSTTAPATIANITASTDTGSFLVRQTAIVPIPAAFYLFGSGLLGFIGMSRAKRSIKA